MPIPSRCLLAIAASFALGACGREVEQEQPSFRPPFDANLLVISLDTTRVDHLSCYGYPLATTPVLERLVADGHRFDAAYTVMPTTLPAHAAMFTSLYPRQLGVAGNRSLVPDGARTLAERLKEHGFSTGAFVSAEPLYPGSGLNQGFDVYDYPGDSYIRASETRERAGAWLRGLGDSRFFCFIHFFDPHTWYYPPEAFRAEFGVPDGMGPPERGFLSKPEQFTPAMLKVSIGAYDAEIRGADHEIGELFAELEQLGLRERTLIVFTADHGETLDELLSEYSYAFDHGEYLTHAELQVPMILWLPPGYPARGPARHEEPVSLVDLMPTLLELLGVECEPPFAGRSLAPLLRGDPIRARAVVSERRALEESGSSRISGQEFSVVDGGWHWIHSDARPDELRSIEGGLGELLDVEEQSERIKIMRAALEAWRQRNSRPLWGEGILNQDRAHSERLEALGYTAGE